jgi:probable HAF family extracellular repeat protein
VKSRTLTCITAITLFAALALPLSMAAQQTRYRPIDLGTFGGPASFVESPAFFEETAQVLNNRGSVVGWANTSNPDTNPILNTHAFQWYKGVLSDLGTLPGGNNSIALWISANGIVVGLSDNGLVDPLLGFPEVNAVLWEDGQPINLGTLEGGHESAAFSVNSRGQVVGPFFNSKPDPFEFGFQERPFLWQNGEMQDLGTLGGPNARADLYKRERPDSWIFECNRDDEPYYRASHNAPIPLGERHNAGPRHPRRHISW